MATVPELTVGVTDQTAYIHRKTLVWKLHSLDFTLVDPAVDPVLHDTVSVDVPEWHGRVSTIESFPLRGADGNDHRWVKVTCTNKLVAETDTAPFGLSDTPNHTTTFPYRDFGYIQTLSDQTDLSTAEHRATAIVYEPGLIPGMTVEITNAAEGLSATEFIITEMTVDWLRDDVPQYQIDSSVEGVPPITLGDIIDSSGCDCAPFECTTDFTLAWSPEGTAGDCTIPDDVSAYCETNDPDMSLTPAEVYLYAGATYDVTYSTYPLVLEGEEYTGPYGNHLDASLENGVDTNQASLHMGSTCASEIGTDPPLYGFHTVSYTAIREGNHWGHLQATFYVPCGYSAGCILLVSIKYVSGPDPRFELLVPCEPHTGQLVLDGSFTGDGTTTDYTTDYPYGSHTLTVDVNGLDWTAQLTESDPTAGDYALSYPPPIGATVTPRYRGA